MKTATIRSRVLVGLEAHDVTITAIHPYKGADKLKIAGLYSDAAERESTVRVLSSISTLGFEVRNVFVSIAPPAPPGSSHLDLPIAVAVLAALGEIPDEPDLPLFGELGLDGRVRPTRGACLLATEGAVVPADNAREAALVTRVRPVRHLRDLLDDGRHPFQNPTDFVPGAHGDAWEKIRGHAKAKRALEVAAAGGHSVLLVGPPGSGKTLIARALHSILPPLSRAEAIEVTKVHSVAGLVDSSIGYVPERPFRAPHHSVSEAGLVGGGAGAPRPGEASLGHRGVLLLDELAEFRAGALAALRRVLRDGSVSIVGARSGPRKDIVVEGSSLSLQMHWGATFPARPQLVASVNPCPCGYREHPSRECRCKPEQVKRYWERMGPWLDLFEIRIDVSALTAAELTAPVETVENPRERISAAWGRKDKHLTIHDDSFLGSLALNDPKLAKLARTIALFDDADTVTTDHVREASELYGVRS